MSVKTFVHKILMELGLEMGKLSHQADGAAAIIKGIDDALKNPIVDGVLSLVLPPAVVSQFPNVERVLDGVIVDLTMGAAIQADVDAAPDTETKLRVFMADMQKYGVARKNMFIQKAESLLLAGLNDNALKENLYDLYTQAKYSLGKKGAA